MNMPTPGRRDRGSTPVIVISVLLALALIAVGVTCLLSLINKAGAGGQTSHAKQAQEDALVKQAITAGAFTGSRAPDPPDVAEVEAGINSMLNEIAQAMRDGDSNRFGRCFDAQRVFLEIQAAGGLSDIGPREEAAFIRGLEQGLGRTIDQYRNLAWKSHEIMQVQPLETPGEVMVYVRGINGDGASIRTRWWLINRSGQWRAYDTEDLDVGLRLSTVTSIAASGRWLDSLQQLMAVRPLLVNGEMQDAMHALKALDGAAFPPSIEGLRMMMIATALVGQGRSADALVIVDRAQQLKADMPAADYLRAVAHNALGDHEPALEAARRYVALLGPDADVLLEIADAHRALEQHDLAATAYGDALDHNPDCFDCLFGLAMLTDLPETRFARFADVADPMVSFETLAISLLDAGEPMLIEELATVHRRNHEDDPNLGYYLAQSRASVQQFDEAEALLRDALPRAPAAERQAYQEALWEAMVANGRALTAYREASAPTNAFLFLADALWWRDDLDSLRELVDVHERAAPEDIWVRYYTGQVRTIEGDHRAAAAAFTAGRDAATDDDTRQLFASRAVSALYDSGQLMEAYKAMPSRQQAGRMLAGYCRREGDVEGLQQLISAHRSTEPTDPIPALWQADIDWFKHDLEAVVQQLTNHADAIADDGEAMAVYDDRMVRALVRLERHEEALLAAKASTARDGDPFYEVVVHAAAGSVDAVADSMRKCLELGYDQTMFYEDEDAGPALSKPAFHVLRQELE